MIILLLLPLLLLLMLVMLMTVRSLTLWSAAHVPGGGACLWPLRSNICTEHSYKSSRNTYQHHVTRTNTLDSIGICNLALFTRSMFAHCLLPAIHSPYISSALGTSLLYSSSPLGASFVAALHRLTCKQVLLSLVRDRLVGTRVLLSLVPATFAGSIDGTADSDCRSLP